MCGGILRFVCPGSGWHRHLVSSGDGMHDLTLSREREGRGSLLMVISYRVDKCCP